MKMKKNFLTKMGAVLMSTVMLLSGVTAVCAEDTAVEATDGYFWLEGEDGIGYGEWDTIDDSSCNGNKYRRLSTENAAPTNGNRITYNINVTEAGKYKTFMRSTMAANEWMSEAKLYIDNAAVELTSRSAESWYAPAAMMWFESSEFDLGIGVHTVTYKLEAPRTKDNKTYVGALDSIAVMPSDYKMTVNVGEKPVAPTYSEFKNGFFRAEIEDAEKNVSLAAISDSGFSGGTAYKTEVTVSTGTKHTFSFNAIVPETAEYQIAVNGSTNGNEWQSTIKVVIDDVTYPLTTTETKRWVGNMLCSWNTATASLTAGKHKITILIDGGSTKNSVLYKYALDEICISKADWSWVPNISTSPVAPVELVSAWLEESDAQTVSGVFARSSNTIYSGGKGLTMSNETAPDTNGYGADFNVYMKNSGEYDIYFRGNIPQEWMSKPELLVDGTKQESTVVKDEGWVNDSWTLGWNKTTVRMTSGKHTIRWALIDSREKSTNNWIGQFDCIVILPKGTSFNITAKNIADTKTEYELCAAMAEVNLSGVTSDIDLPTQSESGDAITWTSSNTDVITNNGKVTRGSEDQTVTLTAVLGEYEKTFTATVRKLVEFDVDSFTIDGNISGGETLRANAEVKYNMGTSKKVMLIIALYKSNGEMISANIDTEAITAVGTSLSTTLTVPSDISDGAYATAYLWNDINDLKPITPCISK